MMVIRRLSEGAEQIRISASHQDEVRDGNVKHRLFRHSLAKKLGITEANRVFVDSAPASYPQLLQSLPPVR
ncbi:hypothetical protein [Undibacterium sp.]|uniref:hypothetical protein n=1 Tax=Undibacterium sp. TaxID=1914977 RepID=UPI00374D7E37